MMRMNKFMYIPNAKKNIMLLFSLSRLSIMTSLIVVSRIAKEIVLKRIMIQRKVVFKKLL